MRLLATLLLLGTSVCANAEESLVYLYNLLDRQPYHDTWNALLAGEKRVPTWLARYNESRRGTGTGVKTLEFDKQQYQASSVCKARECSESIFYVIFTPDSSRAFGRLVVNARTETFYGHPDDSMKDALRSLSRK